jgi:hypothetical protein
MEGYFPTTFGEKFPQIVFPLSKMSEKHFYEIADWGDVSLENVDVKTPFFKCIFNTFSAIN